MRLARTRANMDQAEFAAALSAADCPASPNQVYKWERGAGPDTNSDNVTIVPGYALVAAAQVARVTVNELLRMAGVEGQDPLADQVAELQHRVAELREDTDTWLVDRDELRSRIGMDRVGLPPRLRRPAETSG